MGLLQAHARHPIWPAGSMRFLSRHSSLVDTSPELSRAAVPNRVEDAQISAARAGCRLSARANVVLSQFVIRSSIADRPRHRPTEDPAGELGSAASPPI